MVDFANIGIEMWTPRIVQADEFAFQMVSKRDLVADQRQYELPTDIAKRIMRVEVLFNSTWVIGKEIDPNMIDMPIADETQFSGQFRNDPLLYSLFRNCINIYSGSDIEDVTNGLRLYHTVYPYKWATTDLASSVDISIDPGASSVGIPREFHAPLLYFVSGMYKKRKQVSLQLTQEESEAGLEKLFVEALRAYKGKNRDRVIVVSGSTDSGIY